MSASVDNLLRDLAAEMAIDPSPEMVAKIRAHVSRAGVTRPGQLLVGLAAVSAIGVAVLFGVESARHSPAAVDVVPIRAIDVASGANSPGQQDLPTTSPARRSPSVHRKPATLAIAAVSEPEVVTSQPAVLKALWDRVGRSADRKLAAEMTDVQGPEPPMLTVPPLTVEPIAVGQIRAMPDDQRSRR